MVGRRASSRQRLDIPDPTRPARIVTVCLKGQPARTVDNNRHRLALIRHALAVASDAWPMIDALLFPAGFMRRASECRPFEDLEMVASADPSVLAVQLIASQTPGTMIVFGLDGASGERQQQLVIAVDQHGVQGIAPKLFPTLGDSVDRRPIVPPSVGYSSPRRIVTLANGDRALLAACYDTFGLGVRQGRWCKRVNALRWFDHQGALISEHDEGFDEIRDHCLADWSSLLVQHQPSLVLSAIHGFEAPGLDGMWQRHGIAVGSAALAGALSVGAAHFHEALPRPLGSPLASRDVPAQHLAAGLHRKAHRLPPSDWRLTSYRNTTVLLRLFA